MPKCRHCEADIPMYAELYYEYSMCETCPYILCRKCSDATQLLRVNFKLLSEPLQCKMCTKLAAGPPG